MSSLPTTLAKKNEGKRRLEKRKSGGEMAEQRPAKTHADFWKERIFHPAFTRNGQRVRLPQYSVRIQHAGRREEFPLHTANAAAAAAKARDIFVKIVGGGWDAAISEFKPRPAPKPKVTTVGAYIATVEKVAIVRPSTAHKYAYGLRRIAAAVAGLGDSEAKTAGYITEQFRAWRKKVDAVPLSKITPEKVVAWRARVVASRTDPRERRAAEVTANSCIRSARALFGRKVLPLVRSQVELPDPLPFAGISLKKSARRFRAEVSAEWLFLAAKNELLGGEKPQPELWKALVLCLLGGLRKREADCLTWNAVKLDEARIEIRRTQHFEPKSEEAERDIDLTPEAVEILRAFKQQPNPDPTFVLRGGEARPQSPTQYYRAEAGPYFTWSGLAEWLRAKGITSPKPVHSLRKLAGSHIFERHGIEAAREFLGHSDIQTTSGSYVDKKPKVAVTLGAVAPDAIAAVPS